MPSAPRLPPATLALLLVVFSAACDDIAEVIGLDTEPSLTIVSGDGQEAELLTELEPFVVEATDWQGKPLSGRTIEWSVSQESSGGGELAHATTTTDSQGRTQNTLTFTTDAGTVLVGAYVELTVWVTFEARALPGEPVELRVVSGNEQEAPVGEPLFWSLGAAVVDEYGNPVPGVDVPISFEAHDGGVLDPAIETPRESGVAYSRWTLGLGEGSQSATVSAEGWGSVTATGTATPTCSSNAFHVGYWIAAALAGSDCLRDDGRLIDEWRVPLNYEGAYEITLTAGFDALLLVSDSRGERLLAFNDDSDGSTHSRVRLLAARQWLVLGATAWLAGATGDYSLEARRINDDVTGCGEFWLIPSLVTFQALSTSDCEDTSLGSFFDTYTVQVDGGDSLSATAKSDSFLPRIGIVDPQGDLLVSDQNVGGGSQASVTLHASDTAAYRIFVWSVPPNASGAPNPTGSYRLTVE